MTFAAIQPGLQGATRLMVGEEHTAQHLGSGAVPVLATPHMVLLMEQAAVAAVDHLLPGGHCTVGTHLDVRHLAPTAVGLAVTAIADLLQVEGRRLTFRVQVWEGPPNGLEGNGRLVGDGTHQRVIVNIQRFAQGVG